MTPETIYCKQHNNVTAKDNYCQGDLNTLNSELIFTVFTTLYQFTLFIYHFLLLLFQGKLLSVIIPQL